jgi:ferredoxin
MMNMRTTAGGQTAEWEVPRKALSSPRHQNVVRRPVRKILPEWRRKKPAYSAERIWYRRLLLRWWEDTQFARSTMQAAFALLCVWIGVEFVLFVQWGLSDGRATYFPRPPGAEGFLPISALISLKFWLQTGIINNIHPAALFILLAIAAVSIALKKSFCSWLCPIGTLSESLWLLGQRIFGRNISLPRWLDYPLRTLKYLLLVFFLWSIWNMDASALRQFIYSPYNKVADIKMYLFFAQITTFALATIIALMVLSVFIRNFWCRFLCPYGALLGALSWLSPLKITRNKERCTDCELCTRACPSSIRVHTSNRVWSDECMSCMLCVEACPVSETLDIRATPKGRPVPRWVYGVLVAGVFVAITGLAMLSGNWQNSITPQEYQRRFQELNSPLYQHFHGNVPDYGPGD